MRNIHPFYIVFQVYRFIKKLWDWPSSFISHWFTLAKITLADAIFHKFLEPYSTSAIWKKFFLANFRIQWIHSNPFPLNLLNLLSMAKVFFCWCSLSYFNRTISPRLYLQPTLFLSSFCLFLFYCHYNSFIVFILHFWQRYLS